VGAVVVPLLLEPLHLGLLLVMAAQELHPLSLV
jgi:hypothetical protein